MSEEKKDSVAGNEPEELWQRPAIVESGKIEARLFSDEPDPWGP